jgi:uncharacterized membrane protein YfcA
VDPQALSQLIAASLIIAVGSMLQASVGYGIGPLSTPLLAIVNPDYVPGPILLAVLLVSILIAVRDFQAVDLQGLKWALPTRVIGTLVGGIFLSQIPRVYFSSIFGILVLIAAGLSVLGSKIKPTSVNLRLAGFLSGFMGTTASLGTPAMALVYQNMPGRQIRSTIASFFVIATTLSLFTLAFVGYLGEKEIVLGLQLFPGVGVGFWLSARFATQLDQGYTRPIIIGLSALAGMTILYQQVLADKF